MSKTPTTEAKLNIATEALATARAQIADAQAAKSAAEAKYVADPSDKNMTALESAERAIKSAELLAIKPQREHDELAAALAAECHEKACAEALLNDERSGGYREKAS